MGLLSRVWGMERGNNRTRLWSISVGVDTASPTKLQANYATAWGTLFSAHAVVVVVVAAGLFQWQYTSY